MATLKRRGPRSAEPGATSQQSSGSKLGTIVDGVNAASDARIAYVAVVETTNGHRTRRAYFNLPSAERAVARAESRGREASIVLCALVPVDGAPASVNRR